MVGGGGEAFGVVRARIPRVRPNWWVILAVSLALMALLVAIAGNPSRPARPRGHTGARSAAGIALPPFPDGRTSTGEHTAARSPARAATTTLPPEAASMPPTGPGSSGTASSSSVSPPSGTNSPGAQAPSTTTTATVGPVTGPTTTPAPVQSQPTARSEQAVEYLDPPGTPSITYAFTGAGATEVSVVWSTPIYLTLVVGCPGQSQSVGGTTAMATTLPDAAGPCRATVTEPASESVALAYTITIGPPGA